MGMYMGMAMAPNVGLCFIVPVARHGGKDRPLPLEYVLRQVGGFPGICFYIPEYAWTENGTGLLLRPGFCQGIGGYETGYGRSEGGLAKIPRRTHELCVTYCVVVVACL